MKKLFSQANAKTLETILWNLALISVGSILCTVAINGILIPQKFISAGFSGLSLMIHYLLPGLPVSWLYFLLNIPLFALGWKYVGRRFFLYSMAGMVIFTLALRWVQFPPFELQERIMAALLAGIVTGAGSGIILRSLGSAGGLDILSVIMLQRFMVRLGTTSLIFNSLLLAGAAVLFPLERALYTLIYIYVTSHFLNLVVTGLSQRKAVFIISPQWENIAEIIIEDINRGVTIIEGRGGYTGGEQHLLYTVLTFRELPRLKEHLRRIDRDAFMVVTDTLEVMGRRIGNQPHW
jgi:uncharacterized membrane-anchored protein YitT (DUF2179 family)